MKGRAREYFKGSLRTVAFLVVGGALAGFCNGLLGAGGGVILIILLSRVLPQSSQGSRAVYANALMVMSVLSCLTLFRYFSSDALGDSFTLTGSAGVLIGAAIGGAVGGILLGRLKGGRLGSIFAIATLISGILMITR